MSWLLAVGALLACAPRPPSQEEAEALAAGVADPIEATEAAVAREIDARFDRFVCRPPDGTRPLPSKPVCVEQKAAWDRKRMGAFAELGPALQPLLVGPVVGVGVLVPGVGSASAGERPTPAITAEQGPRMDARWLGWGADHTGVFLETLRKLSVDDTDVAIRIVTRPSPRP